MFRVIRRIRRKRKDGLYLFFCDEPNCFPAIEYWNHWSDFLLHIARIFCIYCGLDSYFNVCCLFLQNINGLWWTLVKVWNYKHDFLHKNHTASLRRSKQIHRSLLDFKITCFDYSTLKIFSCTGLQPNQQIFDYLRLRYNYQKIFNKLST